MNRVEIKMRAKEFAFNNKWIIWKPYLIILGISFVVGLILGISGLASESSLGTAITFILQIALLPATIGYMHYLLKLVRKEQVSDIKEILLSKYSIFPLILVVYILVLLFTSLWSILLCIPGIIYALKMAMVNYILADIGDKMTSSEIMNMSKEMMNGYKMDYFVFQLSFIGWMLLCIVTLGIAIIWVYPYVLTAQTMYYEELKSIYSKTK